MASVLVASPPEYVNVLDLDLRDTSSMVRVGVHMLTGKVALPHVNFFAAAPVSSVKEEVMAAIGVPVRHQKLIWEDSLLADDSLLHELSLPAEGAVLQLVLQLPPQEQVAEAVRLMTVASAALKVLTRKDIVELKSLSRPPGGVDMVLEAVMQLQAGISPAIVLDSRGRPKDCSWKASQSLMKDPTKFLKDLQEFKTMVDISRVPASNIESARRIQVAMGEYFLPECMCKKSKAAAGLTAWVSNIIRYYDVVSQIRADFDGFDIMTELREQMGQ